MNIKTAFLLLPFCSSFLVYGSTAEFGDFSDRQQEVRFVVKRHRVEAVKEEMIGIFHIQRAWREGRRSEVLRAYDEGLNARDVVCRALNSSFLREAAPVYRSTSPVEVVLEECEEGFTLQSTLWMNLQVHHLLARACQERRPQAYQQFVTLLQTFFLDSSEFFQRAQIQLRPFAQEMIVSTKSESALLYDRAQNLESISHPEARDFYERAFIQGSERALIGLARLTEDDAAAYEVYLTAGHRGLAEGYFQIGKMVRDGFVPNRRDRDCLENTPVFWFRRALGTQVSHEPISADFSVSAALALAQHYEKRFETLDQACEVYRLLAQRGYVQGSLGEGKLWENQGEFEKARHIYRQENVGWWGRQAAAQIAPTEQERQLLVQDAERMFEAHFQRLLQFTSQSL